MSVTNKPEEGDPDSGDEIGGLEVALFSQVSAKYDGIIAVGALR